ncbi:MAG TPA: winged helix-turn-helix domain-containing protein [Candidatus Acidoferrum sp.]|nr:winged helix-turn-helix domain-containing protein [Candidatus Acidoferrum sp.]
MSRILKFGAFEVDPATGELRKFGMRQKLGGQPMQLLVALLERPQELVTRRELQEVLWPGRVALDFDLGLKKAVNRARAALGDSAESPRFIETVPRRGYRFLAPVVAANSKGTAGAVDSIRRDIGKKSEELQHGEKFLSRFLRLRYFAIVALIGWAALIGVLAEHYIGK